jgi:hypothetical protein
MHERVDVILIFVGFAQATDDVKVVYITTAARWGPRTAVSTSGHGGSACATRGYIFTVVIDRSFTVRALMFMKKT